MNNSVRPPAYDPPREVPPGNALPCVRYARTSSGSISPCPVPDVAIRSYGFAHSDNAALDVSSGLDSSKCGEAYTRIREIVEDLAENGPRDGEVERARAYAAGSTVLSLESTGAVARRAAGQKVTFGEITSPDATIEALDAVTEDDVRRVAATITGAPVVACVGPHAEEDFS